MTTATRNSPILSYLDSVKLENRTEVLTPLDKRLEETIEKIKTFVLYGESCLQYFYWVAFKGDHQTTAAYAIHTYVAQRLNVDLDASARIWKNSQYNPTSHDDEQREVDLNTIRPIREFLKEIAIKHERKEAVQENFWTSNLQKIEARFLAAPQCWAN